MLHIGGDNVITEIKVPHWMIGQALEKLKLRTRYRISVFLVKGKQDQVESQFVTPSSNYIFREGDTMLVSGPEEDIETLKQSRSAY